MAEPRLQPEEEAAGVPGAAGGAVVWPPGARAERLDIPEAEHGGGGLGTRFHGDRVRGGSGRVPGPEKTEPPRG